MKSKHESPVLNERLRKIKIEKQTLTRNSYGIKLLDIGRCRKVMKLFGNKLEPYFTALSDYDYRNGKLTTEQKSEVQNIASTLNHWIMEHTGIDRDLIVAENLEKALITGNPDSFAISVAEQLADWKRTQPNYRFILGEYWNWSPKKLKSEFAEKELVEVAKAEGIAVDGLIDSTFEIFNYLDRAIDIINDIIDDLCGPDLEEHIDPFEEVKIWRQSYLHVPWRGFDFGDNNQEFTAQYIVQINGGYVDELKVRFRLDLSGSGFDKLEYPIEARAFTPQGNSIDPSPSVPSGSHTTRYHQIHEFVAHQVNFMVVGVVGKAYYGLDGFMTDAGLVPTGTATIGNEHLNFGGGGDSIWKYGISV